MARILIAEDEERISAFIKKGLTANGYAVSVAADGVTALDNASTGEFDLAILDVGLPGMDGFEVLRKLRAANNLNRPGKCGGSLPWKRGWSHAEGTIAG